MSSNLWMGDDAPPQQDAWYGQQQQQQSGGQDFGWGQFDYSQPAAAQPTQAPAQDYYSQQYSSYSQPAPGYAGGGGNAGYAGQMFIPSAPTGPAASSGDEDFENEPPLLEELGINFSHIREKTLVVLNPVGATSVDVIADQDLAGPLVFCLLFGAALMLHGKLQFGFIYGVGMLGCVGMYMLINLMAGETATISFTCTASVLGYCLLPMSILSLLSAVLSFKACHLYFLHLNQGTIGYGISLLAVAWCSFSASKLFVTALTLDHQRLLVAYPCALLYSVFALLAIF